MYWEVQELSDTCLSVDIPIAAYYLPQNAGDIARKFIKDPQLLSFIDAEVLIFFLSPVSTWFILMVLAYFLDLP